MLKFGFISSETNPTGLKALLQLEKWNNDTVKRLVIELTDEQEKLIKSLIK